MCSARTITGIAGASVSKPAALGLMVSLCLILLPLAAAAQSDLIVAGCVPNTPAAQPGGELLLDITIQNVGSAPTTVSAITNYIFIWDAANDSPELQLSPTDVHIAHTLRPLGVGETDLLGSISVILPPEIPLDTAITIAVCTDWADLEPELNEDNNAFFLVVPIEPLPVDFTTAELAVIDFIDSVGYGDMFSFLGGPGDAVYSEVVAERLGSGLDSRLLLRGPHPDSLLALEGIASDIGADGRLTYPGLPSPDEYRLEVFGDDGSVGMYEIHFQKAIQESEPNDDPSVALPINYGDAVTGSLSYPDDADYFSLTAGAGDMFILDFDADESIETLPDSSLDPSVLITNSAGDTVLMDDDSFEYDPYIRGALHDADTYYIRVTDALGRGFPENYYMFKLSPILGFPRPDVTPLNIESFVDPVQAGDTVLLDFETWNLGGLETFAGGVGVDVALSVDAAIDTLDTLLSIEWVEGDLPPASYVPTQIEVPIPSETEPGSYYLGVILDPTDVEIEEDEENNTVLTQIEVTTGTGTPDRPVLPRAFALLQNYPNPVTGRTTITYLLPAPQGPNAVSRNVRIEIFNVSGRRVATLVDEPRAGGVHTVEWNGTAKGRRLASGVYFYRMRVGSFVQTRRMILLR